MLPVLPTVIRLVRPDPVGGDQGAVNNDEVAVTQAHEGFAQARGPRGEDLKDLVDVPPRRGFGGTETCLEPTRSCTVGSEASRS